MATLHVRNVPDALYEALRTRAQLLGRSIGNEAIAILAENVARGAGPTSVLLGAAKEGLEPRERISEAATRALASASYEANARGHAAVDTEHVLLALLAEPTVATALEGLGVGVEDVREAVERHVEPGERTGAGPRPFADGAKRVLELALRESLSRGEGVVGPEHVLFALAAEEEGVAARVLRELGVDAGKLRSTALAETMHGPRRDASWEYRAVALTGSADAWSEQLNALARDGWELFELVREGDEQRAVLRRPTE